MKKIYLFTLLFVIFLGSCTRKHKSDNLHYYQDFESVKGWFLLNTLSTDIKAHSGNYSIVTNQENFYSHGFASTISDISSKPIKKIKALVWCYAKEKSFTGEFCVQIVNPANENQLWNSIKLSDFMKVENKWSRGVIEVIVPEEILRPENKVKVFLWNRGTVPVYGDDFEIEFTE